LHGHLINTLLRLGNDIRIERTSYRSLQRTYGKAVGQAAPATFVTELRRKAGSAAATVTVIPTSLRLSQTCLCGSIVRKSLRERVHRCACGISVQRDIWSAYLARFSQTQAGPDGPIWRLDAVQAQAAWTGLESGLPAVSSPVSVATFCAVAGTIAQSPSGAPGRDAALSPDGGGSEWIAGAGGTRWIQLSSHLKNPAPIVIIPHKELSGNDRKE